MPLIAKELSMVIKETSVIVDGWAIGVTEALLKMHVGSCDRTPQKLYPWIPRNCEAVLLD
jgi:hypothetical protein